MTKKIMGEMAREFLKQYPNKPKEKEEKEFKEKKEKRPKSRITRIINIIKTKPKKELFKIQRATIVLSNKPVKPILRRSEIFNKEYEKEKKLLGWK